MFPPQGMEEVSTARRFELTNVTKEGPKVTSVPPVSTLSVFGQDYDSSLRGKQHGLCWEMCSLGTATVI